MSRSDRLPDRFTGRLIGRSTGRRTIAVLGRLLVGRARGLTLAHQAGRGGIAALEFALVAPVLLTVMLGGTDMVLWMRNWMQMQSSSATLAQIIARYQSLYTSDFTKVFLTIAQAGVSGQLTCTTGGVVVTGVDNSSGTPKVGWQWKSGTCVASSFTTTSGATTTVKLPGGYAPPKGLSAIVVELSTTQASYVLSTGLLGASSLSSISSYSIAIPRQGGLPSYTAGTRPAGT